MPSPVNSPQQWMQPTDAAIRRRMIRSLKGAIDLGARQRILKKYARDYSRQHYIIAQVQDDAMMLDALISQILTHPEAMLIQVRGASIEHMDMWRWEPGRATNVDPFLKEQCLPHRDPVNETNAERKVFESIDGHLRALDDKEKVAALRAMKGEVIAIMCGHGDSETVPETIWPRQTVGFLDAAQLAHISNAWLEHISPGAVSRMYTRFDSCRIVLPQERVEDANSLLAQYVKQVHAGNKAVRRVEASGSRFLLSNGVTSTQFRRSIHPQKFYYFTTDELAALNWGGKYHVTSENGTVTATGRDLALTDQEINLIAPFHGRYAALFPALERLQNVLSRPAKIHRADAANHPDLPLLDLLLQSLGMSGPGSEGLWQHVHYVEMLGGLDGEIRLSIGNGNFQYIKHQRRNLYLLKEKLLHFDDGNDQGRTDESRAFIQRNSDRANVHEHQYLLSAWREPGSDAFSLLRKLAEDTNDNMVFDIPQGDGIGDAMQQVMVTAAVQVLKAMAPQSGGVKWRSLQVENENFPNRSLREVARALVSMSDEDLASALSFFVEIYDASRSFVLDTPRLRFSGALTRQLVNLIDGQIAMFPEHEGLDMKTVIRRVNQHRIAGLHRAIANQLGRDPVPGARGQGAKHAKRARLSPVIARARS